MATTTSRRRGGRPSAVLARRVAIGAAVVLGVVFAVEGGEYGTRDLLSRRAKREALEAEVARLQLVVDSLSAAVRAAEEDPATIERIAREEYGMVKGDRELLYRFAEDAVER
ncbi:MAG TPA: septum formation initiator family protein [Gemmatimonadaceae bacterium]|nr:septum formation initiator family protein [Gemmatimonadaceae bacterium]